MPLTNNVGQNIKELYRDNKKSGKAKGANGKARSRKQIVAIAMSVAGMAKKRKKKKYNFKKMEKKLGMTYR